MILMKCSANFFQNFFFFRIRIRIITDHDQDQDQHHDFTLDFNTRPTFYPFVGTRIFTGTVGTRGPKSRGTYFFMKKVFKKSLNILKYSLGILFYVPIGFAAVCLAIENREKMRFH